MNTTRITELIDQLDDLGRSESYRKETTTQFDLALLEFRTILEGRMQRLINTAQEAKESEDNSGGGDSVQRAIHSA